MEILFFQLNQHKMLKKYILKQENCTNIVESIMEILFIQKMESVKKTSNQIIIINVCIAKQKYDNKYM